jgi:hypothetical protein
METDLIAILIAVGIAALASPVTAQSASHPRNAHGSVARANAAPVVEESQFRDDAAHVEFPRQSGRD